MVGRWIYTTIVVFLCLSSKYSLHHTGKKAGSSMRGWSRGSKVRRKSQQSQSRFRWSHSNWSWHEFGKQWARGTVGAKALTMHRLWANRRKRERRSRERNVEGDPTASKALAPCRSPTGPLSSSNTQYIIGSVGRVDFKLQIKYLVLERRGEDVDGWLKNTTIQLS